MTPKYKVAGIVYSTRDNLLKALLLLLLLNAPPAILWSLSRSKIDLKLILIFIFHSSCLKPLINNASA